MSNAGLNYLATGLAGAIVLALAVAGDPAALLLRYDRPAVLEGELWRMFTGNLVHLGWGHTLMNLAGLALLAAIFARQVRFGQWLTVLIGASLAVTTGLLIFNSALEWYVGLSGTLHGLFVCGLVAHLRKGYRLEWLLLAVLLAKLAWEQKVGPMAGSSELAGGPVVVDAHLYGAAGGLVLTLLFMLAEKLRRADSPD